MSTHTGTNWFIEWNLLMKQYYKQYSSLLERYMVQYLGWPLVIFVQAILTYCCYVWFTHIVPCTTHSYMYTHTCIAAYILCNLYYMHIQACRLARMNIAQNKPQIHVLYNESDRIQHNQLNPMQPCCKQCYTVKPVRTHHCRICNTCILRMDHVCIYICIPYQSPAI